MKKQLIVTCMILSILFVGCATHLHQVGAGPQIGHKVSARQYYLLWGLVPLNSVDTNELAGTDINGNPIENYEIQTQQGPLDIVINTISFFLGYQILLTTRTVTVTK